MTSHSQLQAAQQEVDSVKAEIQQIKQDLATAEQAEDGARVDFLRKLLLSLREQQNILLRVQASGQHCLPCHRLAGLPAHNCLLYRVGPTPCCPLILLGRGVMVAQGQGARMLQSNHMWSCPQEFIVQQVARAILLLHSV